MEKNLLDMAWVIMASGLVFIMQAGFAMVESGMTRSKNSINVAIKNLTDFGVSSVVYWLVGFGLMFGLSLGGFLGTSHFGLDSADPWTLVFMLFQSMFCSTAATIVSGAVAERMRFSSYIIATVFMAAVVYPVFGHWVWGGGLAETGRGWLASLGFVDFAGSTVVHSLGGWVSLAAILVIGPRTGRYQPDGKVRTINGSNMPQAVLGVLLLWFGWFGFNGGSTLAMNGDVAGIILRTSLAGAAGMVGALALGWPLMKRPDVNLVLNGSLAGLVSITAGCHAVGLWDAALIGAVGGALMVAGTLLLDHFRLDDAVGAIPVHLVGGIWGTLALALLGDPAILGTGLGMWEQLGVQAIGVGSAALWSFGTALAFFALLNLLRPLRVSVQDEHDGLNKVEHGVSTEINDLYQVLDTQSKTGSLELRAPVEPFTEAGQIASMYNSVMDRLQAGTIAKTDYLQILENVGDGMLLLDEGGRAGPYYSAVVEQILRTSDIAGRSLSQIMSACLPEEQRKSLDEFLGLAFDPAHKWRHVERLNPLAAVDLHFDDLAGGFDVRHVEFRFKRVEREGRVERLLVLASDRTNEKNLSQEVEETREKSRQEMELLYQVLHLDPDTLYEFMDDVGQDIDAINDTFRTAGEDPVERLRQVFRLTHAVKGNAQMLQLDFIGRKAEVLEDRVQELMGRGSLDGEDFLSLTLLYADLASSVNSLATVLERWTGLRDKRRGGTGSATALADMARRLGERYGKRVRLEGPGLDQVLAAMERGRRKKVRDTLVQLVRNSVFHGIELPADRESQGKAPEGYIRIEVKEEAGDPNLRLVVRDDGRGLDPELIRSRIVEKGLLEAALAPALAERDLVPWIFHPGFSTSAVVDEVGGKGIGMSLVQRLVRDLGGKIGIRTRKGQFCEFVLNIPGGGAHES